VYLPTRAPHKVPWRPPYFWTRRSFYSTFVVFWARDFVHARRRNSVPPALPDDWLYSLPDRVRHPFSALPPENLITRAFVRKGPLSRPRRVVFRALCVCLLSPLPIRTKAFFLSITPRSTAWSFPRLWLVLGLSRHQRAFELFVSYLLETFNETFLKFFSRKYPTKRAHVCILFRRLSGIWICPGDVVYGLL